MPEDGSVDRRQALIDDLAAARAEFYAALDAREPATLERPGMIGDWSARELVAHLGYWAGYAVDVIRAVEDGRVDELYAAKAPVEDVNATVARVARDTNLGTVRKREAASAEVLADALRRMDPTLLDAPVPTGATLEAVVREDGPDHYAEHAAELRRGSPS